MARKMVTRNWTEVCGTRAERNRTFRPERAIVPVTSWMGSIAQDGKGNPGLGYSTSGSNGYPGVCDRRRSERIAAAETAS